MSTNTNPSLGKRRFNVGLFQHFRKCEFDDCEQCEEFRNSPSFKMRYKITDQEMMA